MAQRYDVSLKALFSNEGDGVLRRLLFGGKIIEYLPTEQPRMSNRRVDLLVRTDDGKLHHVEFQLTNDRNFALRMLDYYTWIVRRHGEHVTQVVLYLGRKPMRLPRCYQSPSMDFRFEIVNLRELDATPLLASDDWADNVLALLAKGAPAKALDSVVNRIASLHGEERNLASATLVALSGILDLDTEVVGRRLGQMGMINLAKNKVLGPLITEHIRQGVKEGIAAEVATKLEKLLPPAIEEGVRAAKISMLRNMIVAKFDRVPRWASPILKKATSTDLDRWATRIITAETLEEVLR